MENLAKKLAFRFLKVTMKGEANAALKRCHLSFILADHWIYKILQIKNRHPNYFEYKSFIECLTKYFQEIVITDYRYTGRNLYPDVVIGFGAGFSGSYIYAKKSIYYATGSSYRFQSSAVEDEFCRVYKMFGKESKFSFRIPEIYSSFEENSADKLYLIGNKYTQKTFKRFKDDIRLLPGISLGLDYYDNGFWRNEEKLELLWLGSKGILHKGLHIAADVAKLTDKKLQVVGVNKREWGLAKKILEKAGCQYELTGYLAIGSEKWNTLTKGVGYIIGCSVSEGMSTSILSAASYGIISVSTDTCGVDVGIVVPYSSRSTLVERIADELWKLDSMDIVDLNKLRTEIVSRCAKLYSIDAFKSVLQIYLEEDLKNIE